MEVHEAAKLFPIDDESIGELADDIKKNGQQVPVETCGGKVIDGRRRIRACQIAGVEPITREVNPADPVAYVLSINLHRRHLTESQRAMIGAAVKEIYEKEAKERQKMSGGRGVKGVDHGPHLSGGDESKAETGGDQKRESTGKKSRDAAGEAVNVSGREVDRASVVTKHGVPELIAAVQAGRISVRLGEKIARKNPDVQREIVAAKNPREALRLSEEVEDAMSESSEQAEDAKPKEEEASKPKKWTREPVGVLESQNAINCLCRIPKNDPLREAGLKTVATWIRQNLPRKNSNGKA